MNVTIKVGPVCPGCGMTTWVENFGCALPGCDNYAVLVEELEIPVLHNDEEEDGDGAGDR